MNGRCYQIFVNIPVNVERASKREFGVTFAELVRLDRAVAEELKKRLESESRFVVSAFLPSYSPYVSGRPAAFEGDCVRTNYCLIVDQKKASFRRSNYSGEQQDNFRSLANKALNDEGAMTSLLKMAQGNKVDSGLMMVNSIVALKIVYHDGRWDWSCQYSNVESQGTEQTPIRVVEKVPFNDELLIGPTDEYGEVVFEETISNKRSARSAFLDKIEVLSSKTDRVIAEEKRASEILRYRFAGQKKDRTSVFVEPHCMVPENFYEAQENGTYTEKEWWFTYVDALEDETEYRNNMLALAALTIAMPANKKLFLVCDWKHQTANYGCGKVRQKCHLTLIRDLIAKICYDKTNKWHKQANELAEKMEIIHA